MPFTAAYLCIPAFCWLMLEGVHSPHAEQDQRFSSAITVKNAHDRNRAPETVAVQLRLSIHMGRPHPSLVRSPIDLMIMFNSLCLFISSVIFFFTSQSCYSSAVTWSNWAITLVNSYAVGPLFPLSLTRSCLPLQRESGITPNSGRYPLGVQ